MACLINNAQSISGTIRSALLLHASQGVGGRRNRTRESAMKLQTTWYLLFNEQIDAHPQERVTPSWPLASLPASFCEAKSLFTFVIIIFFLALVTYFFKLHIYRKCRVTQFDPTNKKNEANNKANIPLKLLRYSKNLKTLSTYRCAALMPYIIQICPVVLQIKWCDKISSPNDFLYNFVFI